jgi:DNA-binding NarL/FixJ family response regulator
MTGRPRVVLTDDHHVVLEGLRSLLTRDYDVVGVAHDGDELLAVLHSSPADVVLLDLSLPGKSGLDLLPALAAQRPAPRVLILTMHGDRALAEAALAAGAHGFVPKDAGIEELNVAIREVLEGRRYLSPRVPKWSRRVAMGAKHLGLARLTPRQQEIVRLIGRGRSSEDIAAALDLTTSTVSFHRTQIKKALGLDTEWALVRFAILTTLGEEERDSADHPL